jgi:hypothetical protein
MCPLLLGSRLSGDLGARLVGSSNNFLTKHIGQIQYVLSWLLCH